MGIQRTLRALSDPTRREILNILKDGRLPAGEIAGRFDITAAAALSLFFLPDKIPVRWNGDGVSQTATKWIVLIFPALAAVFAFDKEGKVPTGKDFNNVIILIMLAAEVIILGNAFGFITITRLDDRLAVRITGILSGCLLIYFGNKLPKNKRVKGDFYASPR